MRFFPFNVLITSSLVVNRTFSFTSIIHIKKTAVSNYRATTLATTPTIKKQLQQRQYHQTSTKMSGTSITDSTTVSNIGAVGSTLTDIELAKEALRYFLDDTDNIELTPTSGGVNNIVQYVTLPSGERELLRIYNNGCDTKRVQFEHGILQQLNRIPMSFQVPEFIEAKNGIQQEQQQPPQAKTMVRLSNGADACMCKLIPGGLPKLTCANDLGRAAGELNTCLTQVIMDPTLCNCAPYWKMWDVHHAVTRESFINVMKNDTYFGGSLRPIADRMLQETISIADRCEATYQSLPVQLIHGDLHYDNVLVLDGKVTALLDFEFASFDWRALEIAIGLSKYAGEEPDAMPYFDDYIDGYALTGTLTRGEAEAVPDLINLRILSNIVYFVGRHIAGEDDITSITTRIENYARRVDWVKSNGNIITNRIITRMNL